MFVSHQSGAVKSSRLYGEIARSLEDWVFWGEGMFGCLGRLRVN